MAAAARLVTAGRARNRQSFSVVARAALCDLQASATTLGADTGLRA